MKEFLLRSILRMPAKKPTAEELDPPSLRSYACEKHKFVVYVDQFGGTEGECQHCGVSIHEYPTLNPFVTIH